MLKEDDLYQILAEPAEVQKRIVRVMDLLRQVKVGYVDGRLVSFDDVDLTQYLHLSSSLIVCRDQSTDREVLQQLVNEKSEHEQVIDMILSAVNSICLQEDRDVFVERFLYKYRIREIQKRHCLSNNGYYQCLENAFSDLQRFFHLQ